MKAKSVSKTRKTSRGKKVISREMERELILKAQGGDKASRDALIVGNTGLVHYVAKKYQGSSLDQEDLIQEGFTGLDHAITKFDLSFGSSFGTYAAWWVRARISRAARYELGLVCMIDKHVAREGEVKNPLKSLQAPMWEGGEYTLAETIPDTAPLPAEDFLVAEEKKAIRDTMEAAAIIAKKKFAINSAKFKNKKEKNLLRASAMDVVDALMLNRILAENPMSFGDLAQICNMSRERIRQIEARIFDEFRRLWSA